MSSSTSSPFTAEHVAEWASFGPKPPRGKPTPEQQVAATERKQNCTAMKTRLVQEFNNSVAENNWTAAKIEKELDRLVEEMTALTTATTTSSVAGGASGSSSNRPDYLNGPSGTRDFYPAEKYQHNWLFHHFRQTAQMFGFVEYDAPVLEHVQLYERKAGEEITQQLYNFCDKEDAHVTLRPEMTPTLARLVLNKTNLVTGETRLRLPLKWYSLPQCWRFETTQRGRRREHYQWNMDIVGGEATVNCELELLAAACHFFQSIGIGPDIVGIKVNSRAVLEAVLAKHGIVNNNNTNAGDSSSSSSDNAADGGGDIFAKVCVIIDKLDKIGGTAVTELLGDIGVDAASAADILQALQAPTIDALAKLIGGSSDDDDADHDGTSSSSPAVQQVKRLFELAKSYGNLHEYLIFDASVVRGLAYYTGIVWEAFDRRGELRAIMGGGRYDRLLELYGGEKCKIPCVGFGFGDCVIMELLKELNKIPEFQGSRVDYVVCAYSPDLYGAACNISSKLRACGWTVDLMPTPKKKVKASFTYAADECQARRMVFVAPDEIDRGVVRVKDLRTKDKNGEAIQVDVPLDEIHTVDDLIAAEVAKN